MLIASSWGRLYHSWRGRSYFEANVTATHNREPLAGREVGANLLNIRNAAQKMYAGKVTAWYGKRARAATRGQQQCVVR